MHNKLWTKCCICKWWKNWDCCNEYLFQHNNTRPQIINKYSVCCVLPYHVYSCVDLLQTAEDWRSHQKIQMNWTMLFHSLTLHDGGACSKREEHCLKRLDGWKRSWIWTDTQVDTFCACSCTYHNSVFQMVNPRLFEEISHYWGGFIGWDQLDQQLFIHPLSTSVQHLNLQCRSSDMVSKHRFWACSLYSHDYTKSSKLTATRRLLEAVHCHCTQLFTKKLFQHRTLPKTTKFPPRLQPLCWSQLSTALYLTQTHTRLISILNWKWTSLFPKMLNYSLRPLSYLFIVTHIPKQIFS